MSDEYVLIPRRLKHQSDFQDLFCPVERFDRAITITLDFRQCEYGEPFAMLYVASMVRLLRRRNPEAHFVVLHDDAAFLKPGFMGYASHIGYFRSMGFELGNDVGRARLTRRCFPIEVWDIQELLHQSGPQPVGALARVKSAQLARVLAQSETSDAFNLLQFSIQEIARNALEHSKGTSLLVLGQYWPVSSDAEIVMFDDGVGIFETLMDLELVNIKDNRAALRVALLPGISGVPRRVRAVQQEPFRNSGFGLYMVSRYCGFLGKFEIMSNGDYLRLQPNRQIEAKIPYHGTAVSVHLTLRNLENLDALHERLVREGNEK